MWFRIHSACRIFSLVTKVFITDHLKPTAVSNYLSCYWSKYKFTSLGVPWPLQWEGYNWNVWLSSTCSVWLLVYGGYSSCPIHRELAPWQLTWAQSWSSAGAGWCSAVQTAQLKIQQNKHEVRSHLRAAHRITQSCCRPSYYPSLWSDLIFIISLFIMQM